ncbi:MAG: ABC transporter ATP-binding protein [Luminiphilus sp.]|nr:ABC transporter ATP-binding protein [Luminiphilus sp.]
MIKVSQLLKTVPTADGDLDILRGINLEIGAGTSAAIVGASGSGKSTLLGLLAGMDVASSGEITLDGHQLSQLDEDQRARLRAEKIGFVFQSFQLLPALTARENVMLPLELSGKKDADDIADRLLQQVGLSDRLDHYPTTLSGGEQQRVAIARAFAGRPKILFADEPTGNLDTRTGERVIDLLFQLNASEGTTLVLVTHDDRLAQRCNVRFAMDAGELCMLDT